MKIFIRVLQFFAFLIVASYCKVSRCPKVFEYEEDTGDGGRWYGTLTFSSDVELVGYDYEIELDRPVDLLVFFSTHNTEVETKDNKFFIINNPFATMKAGQIYKGRIMVKYNPKIPAPRVVKIIIDGAIVCPVPAKLTIPSIPNRPDVEQDSAATIEFGESGGNQWEKIREENENSRPDPGENPSPLRKNGTKTKVPVYVVVGNLAHAAENIGNSPDYSYQYQRNEPPVMSENHRPENENNGYGQKSANNVGERITTSSSEPTIRQTVKITTRRPPPPPHKTPVPRDHGARNAHTCGLTDWASPLITEGVETARGQWPWHAALYKTENGNVIYKCGGTLISKNKVVTAHCVSDNNNKPINATILILYLGKYRLREFIWEGGVQTKQVSKIAIHPSYDSERFFGDIAILTLATDALYSKSVRPACIWEDSDDISEIEGKFGSVVGWGLDDNERISDDLQLARLPVVSHEECLESYINFYSLFANNGTFCAGARDGMGPCNGDSGGGLVFNRKNAWFLRGIVSLSVSKDGGSICDTNNYIIFTDVAKHRNFIRKNLS